ncbi:MAG: NAD(P)H-dependent oxidoreductase [Verrucomicrobiota bacterium]|jgi:nitroreductase
MNTTLNPEQLLRQLTWRYATKQFDSKRKINEHDWAALEEALRLSPSSCGLQPWTFILVKDPAMRAKLRSASHDQPQIVEASHLVVFASRTNLGENDIEAHLRRIAEVRGVAVETLAGYRNMMTGLLQSMDGPARNAWAKNHVFIALGMLVASAAVLGIDACPMEGFERDKYDAILGLPQKGLASAVIATLGYRSPADKYAAAPKVRFPREKVFLDI